MRVPIILIFVFLCALGGRAQSGVTKVTDDLTLAAGVARNARIDDIYRRFSKGYRELDHAAVAALYTANAAYLEPNSDIQIGNDPLVNSFDRFFSSIRSSGQTLTISFHIVQRSVGGTMAYDVGVFTLQTLKEGKVVGSTKGKFVVVAVRNGRNWKFQVDGYSDMPQPKPAS